VAVDEAVVLVAQHVHQGVADPDHIEIGYIEIGYIEIARIAHDRPE
jgi:hypothetical protein